MSSKRIVLLAVIVPLLALAAGCGEQGPPGEQGAPGEQGDPGDPGPPGPPGDVDNGTSVEACIGCHGPGAAVPVVSITDAGDAHFVDTNALGPLTASGYRQLDVVITTVDVTTSSVIIDFTVTDELGGTVDDLFAADGRFTIAQLMPPRRVGDPTFWDSLITRTVTGAPGTPGDGNQATQANYERFTAGGGNFQYLGTSNYRYTSAFDPSGGTVVGGETYRLAVQVSAGDLPAGNGWCDFDADLGSPSVCGSGTATRDIVQTVTCNGCHGATSDTKLAVHGGGRTEVEYCVTCHNPGSTDPDSGNSLDMSVMIHKIHYGSSLTNKPYEIYGFMGSKHDYSYVGFTKDIDDCTTCHTGGGADEGNWATVPNRDACGSCHDYVNFDTGAGHGPNNVGGSQPSNRNCSFGACHPPAWAGPLPWTGAPVMAVHQGVARATEATLYAGANGFVIEDFQPGPGSNQVTIDYSVSKQGVGMMNLLTAPEWNGANFASRLAITVGWDTYDYTNVGTSETPASPEEFDGLDVGGVVTDNMDGTYRIVATLPSGASDTITASIDGHPAADLEGYGTYDKRIAVTNVFAHLETEGGRATLLPRRDVVDVGKCNQCHDAAGQGISLHGNNRTNEIQVCVVCHNANNTDITERPSDPTTTPDGKVEESIDFKRMIHQIHTGAELENGIVIYGYNGSVHDFSNVEFIGNRQNCETCHDPGTYGLENAWDTLPSTISTGADVADPDDDLNVSPTAAVCSACHDSRPATDHMKLHGASFKALDEDIH